MYYLIGWTCPEPGKTAMYEAAIDSFSMAIELDPDRVEYWYRRGRISYGLWLVLKDETPGPPETGRCLQAKCLADAISAMKVAKRMASQGQLISDTSPDAMIKTVINNAKARANRLFLQEDYEEALDYYELAARTATDDPIPAFGAGLTTLHLRKGEDAFVWYVWYEEALARARAANDLQSAVKALAELQQAQIADPTLPAGDVNALFEAEGIDLQGDLAEVAFAQALMALSHADYEEAAERYSRGIELAAVATDLAAVRWTADRLRDFLLSHPERSLSEAYWPLKDEPGARESSLEDHDRPDLYWRYRAEFGFRLLIDGQLLRTRPGQASELEELFGSIKADIERAYYLNHRLQNRRDLLVDANIGRPYLRLGDQFNDEALYEQALDAYERAAGHIRPNSKNAALDLTEDLLKAGLTALRLGQVERATDWYEQGIELVQTRDSEFGLKEKVGPAIEALQALVDERPDLEAEAQPILDELQALLSDS
jgi:tetratricopeptide (TPR) repeat protein